MANHKRKFTLNDTTATNQFLVCLLLLLTEIGFWTGFHLTWPFLLGTAGVALFAGLYTFISRKYYCIEVGAQHVLMYNFFRLGGIRYPVSEFDKISVMPTAFWVPNVHFFMIQFKDGSKYYFTISSGPVIWIDETLGTNADLEKTAARFTEMAKALIDGSWQGED